MEKLNDEQIMRFSIEVRKALMDLNQRITLLSETIGASGEVTGGSELTLTDQEIFTRVWKEDVEKALNGTSAAFDNVNDQFSLLSQTYDGLESVVGEVETLAGSKSRTFLDTEVPGSDTGWVTLDGDEIVAIDGSEMAFLLPQPTRMGTDYTADELMSGDVWINIDQANKLFAWNGSFFQEAQDGEIEAIRAAASLISQKVDSITLRVIGSDGTVTEISLNDEGQINLLGTVLAQKIMAEDITATGSFQVDNSVWELLQDTTGFKLQTKAKSTVAPYNPIAKLSMDETGGDFIFGDFGSGLHYVVGSSLYGGGTLTLLNGATGITIEGDVIDIGGGSKVAISSLSIGNAIIPDDFSTPSIGTSSSRFDYIYLSHNPNVSSDRNVKREIREDLPDIVLQLRPVRYKRKGGPETVHYGFIAQDVEAALEAAGVDTSDLGLVTFDEAGGGSRKNYALAYSEFIPLLVGTIQRQQKKIDDLEDRVSALEQAIKGGK
jgi:hypothetical protein